MKKLQLLLIACFASFGSHAATLESKWIALDTNEKPGTKAQINVVKEQSNHQQTVIDLHIPGFWLEQKRAPDGKRYQRVIVPGIGSDNKIGDPDLPSYLAQLAIPGKVTGTKISVKPLVQKKIENVRIWPEIYEELDHEKGTPERFTINEKTYSATTFLPRLSKTVDDKSKNKLRSIPSIEAKIWPMRWNPSTSNLLVNAHSRVTISHPNDQLKFESITQDRAKIASKTFVNWEIVEFDFPFNWTFYTASYLIIYPDASYSDEVTPFATQKRARGFNVTELTADTIGSSCNDFRNEINNWEANVPNNHDAYALLIGDTDVIPHCLNADGYQTDDLYASTNGDDLDEEIYLGRLSVDDEADAEFQISKILAYEDNPTPFCCYDQAALWAHKENAPDKYEGAHETVRTNGYSNPPNFITYYGSQNGITDSDIVSEVDNGVGVLAYRGHGSSGSTATGWNQSSEYFNSTDVASLSNGISQSPVVWSFACTNAKLDTNDSIAELWMEQLDSGSASYYGATRASYTSANHLLDEWMFLSVYDEGLVTQSHAIERAEAQMASLNSWGDDNSWMYLLLGDPDMQIRTDNPINIIVELDKVFNPCLFGNCDIKIKIVDDFGKPLENALIGLYKPVDGKPGFNEVFNNTYSDKNGYANFSLKQFKEGTIHYAVKDGRGNSIRAIGLRFNQLHQLVL